MKIKKLLAVVASAVTAACLSALSVSAQIVLPADKVKNLNAAPKSWELRMDDTTGISFPELTTLEFIVTVTDMDSYNSDKQAGVYEGTDTAFMDFEGHIAIGASEWVGFTYSGLADAAGGPEKATVKGLGGGKYSMTADLTPYKLTKPNYSPTIKFAEWNNRSAKYGIRVNSATLYGAGGAVVASFNGGGYPTSGETAPAQTTAATTAVETTVETTTAETTTTTAATTTEATTTTVETTTTTTTTTEATTTEEIITSEETTTEETTTAEPETEAPETEEVIAEVTTSEETIEETTAPAETEAAAETTVTTTTAAPFVNEAAAAASASAVDFSSRDSSLIVVGIVAGVIIIALVAVILMYVLKKKR